MENIDDDILDLIFDFMVRDLSKYALDIYSKPASTAETAKTLSEDDQKAFDRPSEIRASP